MASAGLHRFDIFEIYARYCDIVSRNDRVSSRESLTMLSKSLESAVQLRSVWWWRRAGSVARDTIFSEIFKLMSFLNLSADSHQFNVFYNFVFLICRENGQKNISVSRAVTAWRLILTGRFWMLNQWCHFVEQHQRHNISEDIWQQLLAFSRCVNEDFEGYDPKGAWPLLIDEFVDHMYRISQANNCSTRDLSCKCDVMDTQPGISNSCSGSKRKFLVGFDADDEVTLESKRFKHSSPASTLDWDSDVAMSMVDDSTDYHSADRHAEMNNHNSHSFLQASACAVGGSLSKGFGGHLSLGCCFD